MRRRRAQSWAALLRKALSMSGAVPLQVIDFHSHHVPSRFTLTSAQSAPPGQKERWEATNRLISDEALLLREIDSGDLAARVVNMPAAQIADSDGRVTRETILAINDAMAELVARHPERIHGMASIDAYDGDFAAREVERAIGELGLKGVFVEAGQGDLLIEAPQARPTLEAAARLGALVFVHPVNPQPMTNRMAPYGRIGTLFARGALNAQALIALVESGVFEELPDLRIAVTGLAFGGIVMAAQFDGFSKLPGGALATMRKHVHVDIMGFNPAMIRAAVDLLGADNVLCGSDWPILNEGPIAPTLAGALAAAGLSAQEQARIAGGNALRLLGV